MSEILLTQEVGSLAKPNWRVQPVQGEALLSGHFANAIEWAQRLDIDAEEPDHILQQARQDIEATGLIQPSSIDAIKFLAARYAVRLQEKAGLDILYDGEQDRPEMYQVAVEGTKGFEWRGRVRAFDNKSYKKAAVVETPELKSPWHNDEFERLRGLTEKTIKVPITGAYTIAAWSFDEFYQTLTGRGRSITPEKAREEFVLDLAQNVIRPNIQALLNNGAEWIQIDEPAATTVPGEVPLFVRAFNESVKDLEGNFSVHICFSDYSLLFPHIQELENCSQFSLEFANRDRKQLGTDKASRPAYEILEGFKQHSPDVGIGLGVSSVHDNEIEAASLVRDRILRAVEIIGDPAKIFPSPDCGLRTRSWEVAYQKLQTVVEGTQLARDQL